MIRESPTAFWECLDPVSPEEVEEDRPYLASAAAQSPYADNVVLPSGRTWRIYGRPQMTPEEQSSGVAFAAFLLLAASLSLGFVIGFLVGVAL